MLAVAVVVEVPLATIEAGDSVTETDAARPAFWVRVVEPVAGVGLMDLSVAVIVGVPAVLELVILAV
jgi:hypothetical protein